VAVRTDFPVCVGGAATSPVGRADERLQTVPQWQWRTIRWRRGTISWLRKKFVAVRGWRVTSDGQRHEGWLLGERATRGQLEEPRYYWSNLPTSASLEDLAGLAHRRHAIEQFHEEDKGELGWDQYQGRLWPGFHRHAMLVLLAYSFLVWLERQQRHRHTRQGRLRDPFPPRPKPRRQTLPAVHREVARWLRHQVVLWWVTTDRFIQLCSYRI
jgi:SRSO17 transposase